MEKGKFIVIDGGNGAGKGANVLPVVNIDGEKLGSGAVGEVTKKLQKLYMEHIFKQTGKRF